MLHNGGRSGDSAKTAGNNHFALRLRSLLDISMCEFCFCTGYVTIALYARNNHDFRLNCPPAQYKCGWQIQTTVH